MNHPASFRDPAGFVFTHDGQIYRQINRSGQADFDKFMSSGLYDDLTAAGLLIPHKPVTLAGLPDDPERYLVIQPTRIATISYPYEWSFSQLQDAALVTLKVQTLALSRGMVLKDASAYNVQFHEGRPVFIDTLSFESYKESEPWQAYRQFCQHFLAPLALMSYIDADMLKLLMANVDGLPLQLTAKLLPRRARLSPGMLLHIYLHAKSQKQKESSRSSVRPALKRQNLEALIDSLRRSVRKLTWRPTGTEWGDYYNFTNYSDQSFDHKKQLVKKYLNQAKPKRVWDLGGNTGEFSRLASSADIDTVSFDIDPVAVEKNYQAVKAGGERFLLPLRLDLTNPSPAIGWANTEREALAERGPADMIWALAIIHHLAIGNNLPLETIASYFSTLGRYLVIEFVPKHDSKVKILLSRRPDIFPSYTKSGFERAFTIYFDIIEQHQIENSERTLYLLRVKAFKA